jgi:hypothetical protein
MGHRFHGNLNDNFSFTKIKGILQGKTTHVSRTIIGGWSTLRIDIIFAPQDDK